MVLIISQVVVSLRVQVLTSLSVIIKYSVSIIEEWAFKMGSWLICRAEFL